MAIGSFDMRSIPAALRSNTLYALIAANVSVFVAVAVFGIFDGGRMLAWLVLPSWLPSMLRQPWSVLSYMFVQTDVLHLLFNMLWLYCFGSILLHVNGGRALVRVYVAGGVAGAAVFAVSHAVYPAMGAASLMGSSASVLAVAVAVAFDAPDMKLNLWSVGPVKIKWIVAAMVLLFCVGFTGSVSSTVAHAGGAVCGAVLGFARRRAWHWRSNRGSAPADLRAELDELLDKVKQSGYDALSRHDKRRLFELSHKIKQ